MSRAQPQAAGSREFGNALETAFSVCLENGDRSALVDYLLTRSNLPGPRANLELLRRFAETVARVRAGHEKALWDLCISFVSIPRDKAFTGSPMEFIPMCGTVGLGALGTASGSVENGYFAESMERLKSIAGDPRWRVRESVAIALQEILSSSSGKAVSDLGEWIEASNWLQMRAVVAGVAEPPLLKDPVLCRKALALHREVVGHVLDHLRNSHPSKLSEVMKSEPLRKLVQALEYTISVVVAEYPDEGFAFLRELSELAANRKDDPELGTVSSVARKIVKGNLKKNRLLRPFPDRVEEILTSLG